MLWTCCCRLRRRKLHEQRKSRKEKAIILADCSRGLGPVSPALQLRQAVQMAFRPWSRIWSDVWLDQLTPSTDRAAGFKLHFSRGGAQPARDPGSSGDAQRRSQD